MNRVVTTIGAVLLLGALMCGSAFAKAGDVMMADFLLFRMRFPAAGQTLEQRTTAVQARVNDLLVLGGFDLSTITVKKEGLDAALYANGKLLVTVDPQTARANSTTPEKLANVWAARLREIYPKVVPKAPQEAGQPSPN